MLTAKPVLMEPVFLVNITAPEGALGGIYSCLIRNVVTSLLRTTGQELPSTILTPTSLCSSPSVSSPICVQPHQAKRSPSVCSTTGNSWVVSPWTRLTSSTNLCAASVSARTCPPSKFPGLTGTTTSCKCFAVVKTRLITVLCDGNASGVSFVSAKKPLYPALNRGVKEQKIFGPQKKKKKKKKK